MNHQCRGGGAGGQGGPFPDRVLGAGPGEADALPGEWARCAAQGGRAPQPWAPQPWVCVTSALPQEPCAVGLLGHCGPSCAPDPGSRALAAQHSVPAMPGFSEAPGLPRGHRMSRPRGQCVPSAAESGPNPLPGSSQGPPGSSLPTFPDPALCPGPWTGLGEEGEGSWTPALSSRPLGPRAGARRPPELAPRYPSGLSPAPRPRQAPRAPTRAGNPSAPSSTRSQAGPRGSAAPWAHGSRGARLPGAGARRGNYRKCREKPWSFPIWSGRWRHSRSGRSG